MDLCGKILTQMHVAGEARGGKLHIGVRFQMQVGSVRHRGCMQVARGLSTEEESGDRDVGVYRRACDGSGAARGKVGTSADA